MLLTLSPLVTFGACLPHRHDLQNEFLRVERFQGGLQPAHGLISRSGSWRYSSDQPAASFVRDREIWPVRRKTKDHSRSQLGDKKQIEARRYTCPPLSVSTSPVTTSHESTEECDRSWGLQAEAARLKELLLRVEAGSTPEEKTKILDSDARVKALFNERRIHLNPVISLALKTLRPEDIFCLKCLVACGQEHLLDIPNAWESDWQCGTVDVVSDTPIRDAFGALASMVEGWDLDGKAVLDGLLSGWDSPGVFTSQILQLMDFEGRYSETSRKSLTSQILEQWENPGVFPTPVIELMDFEGRFQKAPQSRMRSFSMLPGNLQLPGASRPLEDSLAELVNVLQRIDRFYDSIGGILGYQLTSLELILESDRVKGSGGGKARTKRFLIPEGKKLNEDHEFAAQAALWGLEGLPLMGEIYPLGGAGDRLGLVDSDTGECLPVCMLPYCGRTLLEGLIRDLQAREYLHFRVYGRQSITPVAIMTSGAKQNSRRVQQVFETHNWFGRGRENFKLFEQPLVPTVAAADGRWLTSEPLTAVLKPGGHGAIWKLARDEGVFEWFRANGRKAALTRQISNPFAATDVTMLALAGVGLREKKKFGFASCTRNVGTAEGVNVVTEEEKADGRWEYGVTCVEYTELQKQGIKENAVCNGSLQSPFPANTNVLYVDLEAVEKSGNSSREATLPGLIMNLTKAVKYVDYRGVVHSVRAGRMECTMQNIADSLRDVRDHQLGPGEKDNLSTFVQFNDRRKVTSSAKRRRTAGDASLHQTPDGSILDSNRNSRELLTSCQVDMPQMESNVFYLDCPFPFFVVWHPALGPLWDVVRQKIRGGRVGVGSELQLEVAELRWQDVEVDGSFLVQARDPLGETVGAQDGHPRLHYGQKCGRCRLERVKIVNRGVDWECRENVFWQHALKRWECARVVLHGDAEFEARDVSIGGDQLFEVPAGHRMRVSTGPQGMITEVTPLPPTGPSWEWLYTAEGGHVKLKFDEH